MVWDTIRSSALALFFVTFCMFLPGCARSEAQAPVKDAAGVRAPELQPNLGWINTDRPLRIGHELKGQVVLLDFWTYCCINCMHILPDLEYLEKKYADEPVVVIGVHSAKFENEQGRETIQAAVDRYKIHHPVVIDDDMGIWERYAAQAWPTFMLIDPTGRIVGHASGEGHRDVLDAAIAKTLEEARKNGTLARAPLTINATGSIEAARELAFPGKVLADEKSNRLFTADSNHNRIVVSTLPDAAGQSRVLATIGSGKEGTADGSFDGAEFHNPQGMALVGNTLYIADTDNHLLRAADLATSTVRTVSGTGKQGYDRRGGKAGTRQELASPWALEYHERGNRLFIAMAGTHQIWIYEPTSGIARAFAGNGRENIVDGSAMEANLAQPSGLALIDDNLYVADSEVSGIRNVNAETGAVTTVVGRGLFVFGDVDGRGDGARLQHPLGVAAWGNKLLIADTYNHKIKLIDRATRMVTSLYGTGKPGKEVGPKTALFEPGGLSVAGGRVYVADTNNHRVVAIDLASGASVEVRIEGLERPVNP